MSRLVLAAALLAGCNNSTYFADIVPVLSASPGFVDLGAVVVGGEARVTVDLELVRGQEARVLGVDILALRGDGFVYEGADEVVVHVGEANSLDLTFRPAVAGYVSAVVTLVTDTRDPVDAIEIRAWAVDPGLVAVPQVVDLGHVPLGASVEGSFDALNRGDLEVAIAGMIASNAALSVPGAFPQVVLPGDTTTLPLEFTPVDASPFEATVALVVGGVTFDGFLTVRANDCEHGLPASYDADQDGVSRCGGDCDDDRDDVNTVAPELDDGVDNDCDGVTDEGSRRYDDDGDGYCEDDSSCLNGARPGDCQDADAAVSPGDAEVPGNGVDDDCDGTVDAGSVDQDQDGFGPDGGDCDDTASAIHPGAAEVLNGLDDDCDGLIDDGTSARDDDGDGYCEGPVCTGGSTPGDCYDGVATIHPGATEQPNFLDDDCDGSVDEGTRRGDDDGDGYTEVGGDCDDADPDVSPARGGCP